MNFGHVTVNGVVTTGDIGFVSEGHIKPKHTVTIYAISIDSSSRTENGNSNTYS